MLMGVTLEGIPESPSTGPAPGWQCTDHGPAEPQVEWFATSDVWGTAHASLYTVDDFPPKPECYPYDRHDNGSCTGAVGRAYRPGAHPSCWNGRVFGAIPHSWQKRHPEFHLARPDHSNHRLLCPLPFRAVMARLGQPPRPRALSCWCPSPLTMPSSTVIH